MLQSEVQAKKDCVFYQFTAKNENTGPHPDIRLRGNRELLGEDGLWRQERRTCDAVESQPCLVDNFRFTSVVGDACDLSEYGDKSIDIVYSNSVIEHLFTSENQKKMAEEVRRVGRNYYIQTPNYYFPIEPHWLFPGYQFLPYGLRVELTKNYDLGHFKKTGDKSAAIHRVNEVKLLTPNQMKSLFPEGKMYREIFMGLTKSITMYHFPDSEGHF